MPIALRWDRQGLITSIKDLSTQEDGLFVATDGVLIRWVSELVVGWISEASLEGLGLYQGGWNSDSDYFDWMTIYLNLCCEFLSGGHSIILLSRLNQLYNKPNTFESQTKMISFTC